MNKKGEEYGGMSREQILDVPLSVDNGWETDLPLDTTLRELIDKMKK